MAHDRCKDALVGWAVTHRPVLAGMTLGTGQTAQMVGTATGLPVEALLGGPYGGDLQLGARIAQGDVDVLVFFWNPLTAQPHDPDVKALLRVAVLQDIPIACNQRTADLVLRHLGYGM